MNKVAKKSNHKKELVTDDAQSAPQKAATSLEKVRRVLEDYDPAKGWFSEPSLSPIKREKSLQFKNHDLAKQWHPTKNGLLTPLEVAFGSNKKVWWQCPDGVDHEWEAQVNKRSRGNGCPFCSNHKVTKSNSLALINPKLAKEWHPTKNSDLTPFQVTPGSGKKVWWQCSKNDAHEWEAFVNNRNKGIGCPICANKKTIDSNSLGVLNLKLAKEWHPTKNGKLTPFDVTTGSNKKVWWQCPKNQAHEWETYVSFRTRGRSCPHCKGSSTSSHELRLYCELKGIFSSTKHRKKLGKHEIDIYIPEIGVGIEYDGEFWHRGKEKKDAKKNKDLEDSLVLIRLREMGLQRISDSDIIVDKRGLILSDVKKLLKMIKEICRISNSITLAKIDRYLALNNWSDPVLFKKLLHEKNDVEFEKSFAHLFPGLAAQWYTIRNQPFLPENFTPGSNKKVWWKCSKGDDHEWEASICARTRGAGCPICANHKIVSSNSLSTLNPNIAREWHPTRNRFTADEVGIGSNKRVWWKCPNGDDHIWETSVAHRLRGSGCPICSNRKTIETNSLEALRPDLAKEWHPLKNGKLTPTQVTPGSNKKVWWKCSKGDDHEWDAQVLTRNNGLGCPICSNQKVSKSNCLATLNPKLAKEWHPTKNGTLTPADLTPGSGKSVWWLGKCGHEWKTSVRNRTSGKGCYRCRHIKAKRTRQRNRDEASGPQIVMDFIINKRTKK